MGMKNTYIIKLGILISLLVLGACRSSGEMEDDSGMNGSGAGNNTTATTAPVTRNPQPTAEELAMQRALNRTTYYFDFDVAEFRPADRETLTYWARNLAANPNNRVRLEGHADERGTREYNLALGERRANGIRDFLIVNGAARSQIETVSYGEERPSRTGTNEEAYQANRRVEVIRQ